MEISFRLSTKDIARAKREIREYQKSLVAKCSLFVEKLAERGIAVAVANSGEYAGLITFSTEVESGPRGATGLMLATSGTLRRTWLVPDGKGGLRERSADISPLLMAEYGSGWKSSEAMGKPNVDKAVELGMVQGIYWPEGPYTPDRSERNHAFDYPRWYWLGTDYEWHSSEEPTMPMFKAALAMEQSIFDVAKEVFGT